MKPNQLTEAQMQWIKENETMLKVSLRMTPDQTHLLFSLYNHITGENKNICLWSLRSNFVSRVTRK